MRLFEIVIPICLAVYLLFPSRQSGLLKYLPLLALFLILPHALLEGIRWQMIPIYGLTLLTAIISITPLRIHPLASYLTFILLALSAAVPALLPVPRIPTPSGPYPVGTTIIEYTDTSRKELYSGRDEPRRFLIQVWYPAKLTGNEVRAAWMDHADIYAPAIATYIDLPSYFLDHLELVKIPAYQDAAVAEDGKPFPVITFSHGWNSFNAQSTGQALQLASHGFVVIGVQHPYGAVTTVFADGTIAPNNPSALPEDDEAADYEEVARILVDQWAGDIAYVLDQLQVQNEEADSLFFQKLDMDRIGVYGHSTGGGAAIEFCHRDSRCKAVLGMDPFMRPVSLQAVEDGLSQPSFFMFSQGWADLVDSRNNAWFNQFYPQLKNNYGVIKIEGTKHYDFSDIPLLSPIAAQLDLKGPLNGKRVTEIVNAYLLGFFEMTLNGQNSALFAGGFAEFTEVKKLK